ncbi:Cht9p, partial [Halocaridina rubra]
VLDPYNELCDNWGRCAYDRFVALKEINPDLKVLLAVGGWTEGSVAYSAMASDPATRKVFIDSSIALLKAHGFDGYDIDWEYPGSRGGGPKDKMNFVTLLSELRVALDQEGMLLTAAVSAGIGTIEYAYDIPRVSEHLDYINIMAYDMHGAWETFTHHNAPLYAHPMDNQDNQTYNIDTAIRYWIDNGADRNKIVMGIPTYGRCYTLDDMTNTGFYAPASQPGHAGPYTRTAGTLGYNEICKFMQETGEWVVVHDPAMNEPYAYYPGNKIWCGYDDAASTYLKGQYAKAMGLAGTMVWSLETDDFSGLCSDRKFHLIKSMGEGYNGAPFITQPPTTAGPTHAPVTGTPDCSTGDYYLPGQQCDKYWHCVNGLPVSATCAPGLVWNPETNACDWPTNTDTSNCLMPGETLPPVTPPPVTNEPTKEPSTQAPPGTVTPPETQAPITPGPSTLPPSVTNSTPAPTPLCENDGVYYLPHEDCDKFWQCVHGEAVLGTCAPGLVWNAVVNTCDWPVNVDTSN